MSNYSVQMLKVGEADLPGPEVFWMSDWGKSYTAAFQVALIRGNGITALVNTGAAEDLTQLNEKWISFLGPDAGMRREDSWWILNQLSRVNVAPEDVTHIFLTPLQLYTVSNVPRFPNAQICISKRGWIQYHTTHQHPHDDRWFVIPKDVLEYLVFDGWDKVRLLEDEEEIAPGLRTWWTGGHHRASIAVEIDTKEGVVVISDAFFMYQNLERNHPIGITENMYEALAAQERTLRVAQHPIPLYDPLVFERYPDGIVSK